MSDIFTLMIVAIGCAAIAGIIILTGIQRRKNRNKAAETAVVDPKTNTQSDGGQPLDFARGKSVIDIRAAAAQYYDLQPDPFSKNDINFYISQVPSADASVLEIGCGSGRVTLPLAGHCNRLVGIDVSKSMIDVLSDKLKHDPIASSKVDVKVQDACDFRSDEKFDLIIAPFRVFQNIEADDDIARFFSTIRNQLKTTGRCILNVFKPFAENAEEVRAKWELMKESAKAWEIEVEGFKVVCNARIREVHPKKLICYPTISYEVIESNRVRNRSEINIPMRCYFPDEFIGLIESNGFKIEKKWGGYSGEAYGEGPELVVKFRNR